MQIRADGLNASGRIARDEIARLLSWNFSLSSGIIAVLIELLMPAVTAALEQSKSIKCLSNRRSLGEAALPGQRQGFYRPITAHTTGTINRKMYSTGRYCRMTYGNGGIETFGGAAGV